MIRFECDYLEGAHPKIMEVLNETNFQQTPGYGEDFYCESASKKIRMLCKREDAAVHFLVGGTQTNTTVISAILRPYQGVVSAHTGHINNHETGAIESSGHKVLAVTSPDGKLTASQIQEVYDDHHNDVDYEHMVQPGMVYISHPTETGTMYTKKELREISAVCRKNGLPLFLDGARLGYGLAATSIKELGFEETTLADVAALCDIFYIGGTKVGALFGEAVVIPNKTIQKEFRYMIKQRGGMLAKGRLLGLQFDTLLEDDLYFQIAEHGVRMAMLIRNAFLEKGYPFLYESYTNQQFPIIPDDKLEILAEKYSCAFWKKVGQNHSAVRFCTSWATKEDAVKALVADVKAL